MYRVLSRVWRESSSVIGWPWRSLFALEKGPDAHQCGRPAYQRFHPAESNSYFVPFHVCRLGAGRPKRKVQASSAAGMAVFQRLDHPPQQRLTLAESQGAASIGGPATQAPSNARIPAARHGFLESIDECSKPPGIEGTAIR